MDKDLVKVEGDLFVKNKKNGALLAVNKNLIAQNQARKKLGMKISGNDSEINNMKSKIEELSNDIGEIKSLLQNLIQKKD